MARVCGAFISLSAAAILAGTVSTWAVPKAVPVPRPRPADTPSARSQETGPNREAPADKTTPADGQACLHGLAAAGLSSRRRRRPQPQTQPVCDRGAGSPQSYQDFVAPADSHTPAGRADPVLHRAVRALARRFGGSTHCWPTKQRREGRADWPGI